MNMIEMKKMVRDVPDFPKPGILFKDITTLIKDKTAFNSVIGELVSLVNEKSLKIDKVVGVESRGFIFGAPVAYVLNAGIVPVRKKGKLPALTVSHTYKLEYGEDTLEIHKDAVSKGENVLLVDDLLATGGTSLAAIKLIEKLGGRVAQVIFVIELEFLAGRKNLAGYDVQSLLKF